MDIGADLPDLTATAIDGTALRLRTIAAPLAVYFYPKDDTTGCTREAQDFSELAGAFADAGVSVIGISRDDPKTHAKFVAKHALSVPLASDLDGSITEAFGVWGEKQMYGRTYMGIERATFLFDANRQLVRSWRKVRVPGHASEVLEAGANLAT